MASPELTELEKAIEKVVYILSHCASHEGNKVTITTSEFKELVTLQLPNHMKNIGNMEEKMKNVKLKFEEYWQMIGELAQEIEREKVGKKK